MEGNKGRIINQFTEARITSPNDLLGQKLENNKLNFKTKFEISNFLLVFEFRWILWSFLRLKLEDLQVDFSIYSIWTIVKTWNLYLDYD